MEDFVPDVGKNKILSELKVMKERMDVLYAQSVGKQAENGSPSQLDEESWRPFVDILEHEDAWVLSAALPGVSHADLRVEVAAGHLIIEGKREGNPQGEVCQAGIRRGDFRRRFLLPRDVEEERITAAFKQGTLTVTLPKSRTARGASYRIEVQPG
jgi:HSP20 family molecular chaperone IbpA